MTRSFPGLLFRLILMFLSCLSLSKGTAAAALGAAGAAAATGLKIIVVVGRQVKV